MTTSFGAFLRELRQRRKPDLTMRRFAYRVEMDPSQLARIERDEVPAPTEAVLARIATGLDIAPGTDPEWYDLVNHASAARGEIPSDLRSDADFVRLLPAFYAKVRDAKAGSVASEEELMTVLRAIVTGED